MNDGATAIEPDDQCGNCMFRHHAEGVLPPPLLYCRRFPPITVTVCQPNPLAPDKRPEHENGDWVTRFHASSSVVAPGAWCAEHKRGDALPAPTPKPLPAEIIEAATPPRAAPKRTGTRRHRRIVAPI